MVKIKICGLFAKSHIEYVNRAHPDYAGFVFYPPSHRYVTEAQMRTFRKLLAPDIPAVGVFVDVPAEQVGRYLSEGLIQIAQLHGHEDDAYIKKLRDLSPDHEIWKAFKVRSDTDLDAAKKSAADRILLDNGYGTGACFDWQLLEGKEIARPFLLAGGLCLENIEQAVQNFAPWGLDLSSGVETDRQKDEKKIRQTVRLARRMHR